MSAREPAIGSTTPRDPEELEASAAATSGEIAAATTVGAVHLTVSALDRSLAYYEREIGLALLERGTQQARLGAGGRELLVLVEEPGARPARGFTGLYHFALRVPKRIDLARWLAHAARDRVRLVGLSDHFVSEAIYLSDPDEHGIEIYCDRPREGWEGKVGSGLTTIPLDVHDLLGLLDDPASEPFSTLPAETVMGHVHLRVASIREAVAYYRDVLGLGLMMQLGDHAAFLSAGGYHHHIGANTWESAGAPPAPPGTATLRHATVVLPDATERDQVLGRVEASGSPVLDGADGPSVVDPSGNRLALVVSA
jgi:catechol 2,3-dioxygenase